MTDEQERAGIEVMRGSFRHRDVREALMRANVPIAQLESATDSLIQQERKAGNIRLEKIDGEPVTSDDRWVKV